MKSVKIFVKNETRNRMSQFDDGGDGGGSSGVAKAQLVQMEAVVGSNHSNGNACDILRRGGT